MVTQDTEDRAAALRARLAACRLSPLYEQLDELIWVRAEIEDRYFELNEKVDRLQDQIDHLGSVT